MTVFGWSGSALLGGYLVDRHGFAMVFLLTAALQALSCIAFNGPLLAMVPLLEEPGDCGCEPDGADSNLNLSESASLAGGVTAWQLRCDACGCAVEGGADACACGKALRRDGSMGSCCAGAAARAQPCQRHGRGSRRVSGELDAVAASFDDEWGTLAQPLPRVEGRASREERWSASRRSHE